MLVTPWVKGINSNRKYQAIYRCASKSQHRFTFVEKQILYDFELRISSLSGSGEEGGEKIKRHRNSFLKYNGNYLSSQVVTFVVFSRKHYTHSSNSNVN